MRLTTRSPYRVTINLDVNRTSFFRRLNAWAAHGPLHFALSLVDLWNEEIFANLTPHIRAGRILAVKIAQVALGERRYTAVDDLLAAGDHVIWWHRLVIDVPLAFQISPASIEPPTNMEWRFSSFGRHGHYQRLILRHKALKTRNRYSIALVNPVVPGELICDAFKNSLSDLDKLQLPA